MNSISLVFLISQILIRISVTTAGSASHCSEPGNFTANSTYAKSLSLILSSLPFNTSTANGLFYTTTTGQDPDKIHVLALCSGDSSPEDCTDCINTSIQEMTKQCPNKKQVYSWTGYPVCIVRYSNRSILGKLELTPDDQGYNTGDITTNMEQFDQTWEGLMERVLTKASMGNSTLKFATGNVDLTAFQKIYTIMQCTPDLTHTDCRNCLREVVSSYQRCCHVKQGGYVFKPSCFFRWDLYPFYNSSLDASSPSPSPLPSPIVPHQNATNPRAKDRLSISSRTIMIILIATTIFIAFLVLFYFLFKRRKPRQEVEESLQYDFGTIKAATHNFS